MIPSRIAILLALTTVLGTALGAHENSELLGRWEVTTSYAGGSFVAGLDLEADANRYTGRSGYLVPDFVFPYKFAGAAQKDGLHLQILAPDGTTVIGKLVLSGNASSLSGEGTLHDNPIT